MIVWVGDGGMGKARVSDQKIDGESLMRKFE